MIDFFFQIQILQLNMFKTLKISGFLFKILGFSRFFFQISQIPGSFALVFKFQDFPC